MLFYTQFLSWKYARKQIHILPVSIKEQKKKKLNVSTLKRLFQLLPLTGKNKEELSYLWLFRASEREYYTLWSVRDDVTYLKLQLYVSLIRIIGL